MTTHGPTPLPPPADAGPPMAVRGTDDLLALVPVVLGFTPTDSVVLLTFGGRAFHARVDLPSSDAAGLAELVSLLEGPVRRHRVACAALLLYTGDSALAAAVSRALAVGLGRAGLVLVEELRVHQGRWWPARGRRPGVPERGVPFDVSTHPFLARAVADGRVALPSREALARTVEPLVDDVAAVAAVAAFLQPPDPGDRERCAREGAWVAALLAAHLEARSVPPAADLARLLVGLRAVPVRDAAWAVTPPAAEAPRAREAADLWAEVVRRAPRPWRAPAAALLAYAAWNSGNGALAWCAVDVAEEADPDHTLTGLVAALLRGAVRPGSLDGPGGPGGRCGVVAG